MDEAEVSIEVKYGYVVSDDSGKAIVVTDSVATNEPSAAQWVKSYPQRFILGGGETQTIRLVAYPPPGLAEGEYWTRVVVLGRPRKPPPLVNPNFTQIKGGMGILVAVGLPFHYRVGKVTTGLTINKLAGQPSGQKVTVNISTTRIGNAAYWGSRLLRLINSSGKVIYSSRKNVAVFKTFNMLEDIDRKDIPPGDYTLDVEFVTSKRSDLRDDILVQAPSVHMTTQINLP